MPQQKKIVFVPTGGLCNRMRAMAGSVSIAKRLDRPLAIYWRKSEDCFADFNELFDPVNIDNVEVFPLKPVDFHLFPSTKFNLYIPGKIRTFFFDTQLERYDEGIQGDIFGKIKGNKIYLNSWCSMTKHYPLRELFQPKAELKEQINAITHQFSSHTIGVHIRRTDHRIAMQHNSINDFCEAMNQELILNPDTKFYLATDDMEVKNALLATFENKIIYHNALLSRKKSQGMKDAVVDLWCLSRTKKILGSFSSSFSDIASEMGNTKLEIVKSL